jgi:NAD(P)H dehydrogenase (quinone)
MKVLIVYYSAYGNVYRMANLVAEGVKEIPGVQPVVRTVPELIPKSVINSREDMKAGREMQQDVPLVTQDDFREAGAIAFGTPTRFGNVAAQLKNEIDQLTSLWLKGELEGKPAGAFVSTGSLHGGQETTILTLMAPLLHLGMILVGVPYSTQELFTTQKGFKGLYEQELATLADRQISLRDGRVVREKVPAAPAIHAPHRAARRAARTGWSPACSRSSPLCCSN